MQYASAIEAPYVDKGERAFHTERRLDKVRALKTHMLRAQITSM